MDIYLERDLRKIRNKTIVEVEFCMKEVKVVAKIKDVDSAISEIANRSINLYRLYDGESIDNWNEVGIRMKSVIEKNEDILSECNDIGIFETMAKDELLMTEGIVKALKNKENILKMVYVKFLIDNWLDKNIEHYLEKSMDSQKISGTCKLSEYSLDYLNEDDVVEKRVELGDDFAINAYDDNDRQAIEDENRENKESGSVLGFLSSVGAAGKKFYQGASNMFSRSCSGYGFYISGFLDSINDYLSKTGFNGCIEIKAEVL